ncbi:MAG: right-handed parallel beta-helix repeat-containing protein [Deltaproteobacteria bacterium]|nr:right-handed parallel beta-helix repeat-containing protein [Deltaproteobacteria bacterium]
MGFAALAAVLPGAAWGAPHTVCPGGTCDHPTISACATAAQTDDVCEVQPGVYHETVDHGVNLQAPVTLRCTDPATGCVVDGDGVRDHAFYLPDGWTVEGFEVRNTASDAFSGLGGQYLAAVRDCWVHDVGGTGIGTVGAGGVIERNVVDAAWSYGILCRGAGVTVRNNLVTRAAIYGGSGIHCADGVVTHATVDVRDTTFAGGAASGVFAAEVHHSVVLGGLVGLSATTGSSNNTVSGWGTDAWGGVARGTGDATTEPAFLGLGDYHLAEALPATGSVETEDLEGDLRVDPPDRGAFEYDVTDVAAPPLLVVDEVVATPTSPAPHALVLLPDAGPALLWLDPNTDVLTYAVRDGDDSWAQQDVATAVPPEVLSLDPYDLPLAAAIDWRTGRPVVAWLADAAGTTELRFARAFGGGCGSGCASSDWEGCDDPPLLTFDGAGAVAVAVDPVDGSLVVALAAPSGADCGGSDDWAVDLFRLDEGGWTVQTLETGGCTHRFGLGIDVSVDPADGDAEVVYTRAALADSEGDLRHAVVTPAGGATLATLAGGSGFATWQDRHTRVAIAHDAAGDLHVAFSANAPEGAWAYAALHRIGGTWGDPYVFDLMGTGGARPQEGLDLAVEVTGAPMVAHARNGTVRFGPLHPDESLVHLDVRRTTGWWTALAPLTGSDAVVAWQEASPGTNLHVAATVDPLAAPAGGGLDLACTTADPCQIAACDPELGCIRTPKCADDDPCTDDVCDAGTCENPPVSGGSCDDGNPSTVDDACVDGACVGTLPPVEVTIIQNIQVTDTLTLVPPAIVELTQPITVSDETTLVPPAIVELVQQIVVTDQPPDIEVTDPGCAKGCGTVDPVGNPGPLWLLLVVLYRRRDE